MTLLWLVSALPARAVEVADKIDETVAEFFRPFENEGATLSPDGRHVAMAERLKEASSVVVHNIDDRTSKRYFVGGAAEHLVLQLQWVSSKRLVFTTRSRAVGTIDLDRPAATALLVARDLDFYLPEAFIGPRSFSAMPTADLPADPVARSSLDGGFRENYSLSEALKHANVTGDLFGSDSKRDAGRAMRPFLLGLKPDSATTLLVELRADGDPFAYGRSDRTRLTVPGNVFLGDRNMPPPSGLEDLRGEIRPLEYATYDIEYRPPPLVILELDTIKGRTREVAVEHDWRRVWLDHQGRLRVVLEQKGKRFRYLYRGANTKKWVALDSIVKSGPSLGFAVGSDNLLGPRSVPLGFDAKAEYLLIASNVGRDTFTLQALDLATGRIEPRFEMGNRRHDLIEPTALTANDVLRFDRDSHELAGMRYAAALRHTRWLDPEIVAVQAAMTQQFPSQRCEVREWSSDRTRFLVDVSSPTDPGAFFVFDANARKLVRCGQRAPWLAEARRNLTQEFEFVSAAGNRVVGYITLPKAPRLNPAPVLVYFHDGPWFSDPPLFNRGAQALAALGFAVVQLNHRGSSGLGRNHLTGIDGALDRTVLADVTATLDGLSAQKMPINPRMVAALGNGIGGYLAVRMAQLAPETFRCGVAINAPGDLAAWRSHPETAPTILADLRLDFFGKSRETLLAQSALTGAATTKAPVLVVHGTENSYVPVTMGRELYRALKAGADESAYLELAAEGHSGWSEKTTSRLFAELGRFFNATIYNYGVNVRTPQVVP